MPVDVVMDGGEVYFILENPQEISAVRVMAVKPGGEAALLWELRHNMTTPVKERRFPKVKQLKYGVALEEFPVAVGPAELQKNVEYTVHLDIGKNFAKEVFMITDDKGLVVPRPAFSRQRGRVYTAVTDKDGKKTFVLK
ncbi:MAG: hypothetical protein A2285_03680 [Elusimicrobia bacterium RIFOXYA12_FULL_57_11]|nr:MAG: hypothetical protein A2285_03680 [Elusimicrobia bacterium RIFOXYA12_FULL_57_11]